jgi:hypothetical protein
MESNVSVARLLSELEKKVALHRERQAFHAEQAATHEAQRALHEAELQRALERFEALRAAVTAADEVLAPSPGDAPQEAPPSLPEPDEIPQGKGAIFAKLVDRIVARKAPGEVFGATEITHLLNGHYSTRLGRRADSRTVAQKLRRMALSHRLVRVREGKSFYEALYRRRG